MKDRKFKLLQCWLGIVDEVCATSIFATLKNQTSPEDERSIAEIPMAQICKSDQGYVFQGAIFYFSIISMENPFEDVPIIRFQKPRYYTKEDIEQAKILGKAMFDEFNKDNQLKEEK